MRKAKRERESRIMRYAWIFGKRLYEGDSFTKLTTGMKSILEGQVNASISIIYM